MESPLPLQASRLVTGAQTSKCVSHVGCSLWDQEARLEKGPAQSLKTRPQVQRGVSFAMVRLRWLGYTDGSPHRTSRTTLYPITGERTENPCVAGSIPALATPVEGVTTHVR